MRIDREKLKKNSKASLGISETPHRRVLRNYTPSSLQRRIRLVNNLVGVLMFLALAIGTIYLVYTLVDTGKNIAERKINELEKKENAPETRQPNAEDVQIIFIPSKKP